MSRKKLKSDSLLIEAVLFMMSLSSRGRNLHMSGDERYQPKALKALLGYDSWAGWLIIVEFFWLKTLAKIGEMPPKTAKLLTKELLFELLQKITTTQQDNAEYGRGRFKGKGTNHDINALLLLMRKILPQELHPYLHLSATSYDIISTAYALQIKMTFELVFWPKMREVDVVWRERIAENAKMLQVGRTHLQHALPLTAGFWLAQLHSRWASSAREAKRLSQIVPGKFSGACGTSASQRALFESTKAEAVMMEFLGLPAAEISTQITPPEATARFYYELTLNSGAMANLGEDIRILAMLEIGEVILSKIIASGSSAMTNKDPSCNPITAENLAGMHWSVIANCHKLLLTLVSDLQRDLRGSNVIRSYSEVMVYVYQQLLNTEKLLKNFKMNEKNCLKNFDLDGHLATAELLHLSLGRAGLKNFYKFVNGTIVPAARQSGNTLDVEMDIFCKANPRKYKVKQAWDRVPEEVKDIIHRPKTYLGDAVLIAKREARNALKAA